MTPTYGVLVSGGIAAGAVVIWLLAPRLRVSSLVMMDIIFWTVLGGIVGARALYVLVEWPYFAALCAAPESILPPGIRCSSAAQCYAGQECDGQWCRTIGDCLAAVKFWQGGWVFLGGVLGALPAAAIAARVRGVPQAFSFALLAVGLPLGHAFGRVGCYVKGCCFGRSAEHLAVFGGRHPAQLYEALAEAVIFGVLLLKFLSTAGPRRKPGPWELAALPALYVTLYAPMRFLNEFFRGDHHRGFVARIPLPSLANLLGASPREPLLLSTSQAISLVMFGAALLFWVLRWRATSRQTPRTVPCGTPPVE